LFKFTRLQVCQLIFSLLITYWLWAVDWTVRNDDLGITKYLVTYDLASILRLILALFLVLLARGYKKYFLLIAHLILLSVQLSFLHYYDFKPAATYSSSLLVLLSLLSLPNHAIRVFSNTLFHITFYLLLFSFGVLLFIDIPTANSGSLSTYGLTVLHYQRFASFLGGPIACSIICAILLLAALFNFLNLPRFLRICTVITSFLAIVLSGSVAGPLFLLVYLSLRLKYLNPRIRYKAVLMFVLFIFLTIVSLLGLFIFFGVADNPVLAYSIDHISAKFQSIYGFVAGQQSSSSVSIHQSMSNDSLYGRLYSCIESIKYITPLSLFTGNIISFNNVYTVSESSLLSMIAIYGFPFAVYVAFNLYKCLGLSLSLTLFIISVPYNPFVMFPVVFYILLLVNPKFNQSPYSFY
jgi:hypothetical protein